MNDVGHEFWRKRPTYHIVGEPISEYLRRGALSRSAVLFCSQLSSEPLDFCQIWDTGMGEWGIHYQATGSHKWIPEDNVLVLEEGLQLATTLPRRGQTQSFFPLQLAGN